MSSSSESDLKNYSFALALPVYHFFDYRVDSHQQARPGQRFHLPFGSGRKPGILIAEVVNGVRDESRLKNAGGALDDQPLLSTHMIELAQWMADYYCQPIGEVLFQCLPRYCRQANVAKTTAVSVWRAGSGVAGELGKLKSKAPRQYQILQALQEHADGLDATALRELHKDWHKQIRALQEKQLVEKSERELFEFNPVEVAPGPSLTEEQAGIRDDLLAVLDSFNVHLLQGVTGSGKTEIYLDLMQQVLEQGHQVIYLVPEIGLTPQLFERIRRCLGNAVVSAHSAQSDYQRYQGWDSFRRGKARVMIGTRSALFSEAPELGLIIIDEEHDASYRQQDGVRYHARDVAIKRAQMLDIPVVLGSATPSLESLHNLQKPHYRLHLLSRRPDRSQPPRIQLIDCKNIPLTSGCSSPLLKAVQWHLSQQGQVLLFLNRRGYAPIMLCHDCGWQAGCVQCDARLTLHQSVNRLICHHCGYHIPVPQTCPQCGKSEIRHYGVGTQQLEDFLQQQFPQYAVIRIDRDSVQSAQDMQQRLQPVRAGEPCILVGTQMLAKGHDYPNISLVGILDADQALYSSFYRAPERLVQTVLQVSGRAGRAGQAAQALLQTAFVSHPLLQNLCHLDYTEIVKDLMQERQLLGFPPFVRVVTLVVDALELDSAMQRLQKLVQPLQACSVKTEINVIGPIPTLMTRRVGRYRAQLSVMASQIKPLRIMLRELMPVIGAERNTAKSRLVIEVDPLDL